MPAAPTTGETQETDLVVAGDQVHAGLEADQGPRRDAGVAPILLRADTVRGVVDAVAAAGLQHHTERHPIVWPFST